MRSNANVEVTKTIAHFPGSLIQAHDNFKFKDESSFKNMDKFGVHIGMANDMDHLQNVGDTNFVRAAADAMYSMDNLQSPITTPTIPVPVQWLQEWAPGFIRIVTTPRMIDTLVGLSIIGSWEMEEVIKTTIENLAVPTPYGDNNNVNFSSWNPQYERRSIVRNTVGMNVTALNQARAALARISNDGELRISITESLEILRNIIGFYGYNNGLNNTYGFLTDPTLPNYVNVPNGTGGSPLWANKTFLEIVRDVKAAAAALIVRSGGNIMPYSEPMVMGIANAAYAFLATVSDFGVSVNQFIEETFKGGLRIVPAYQLDAANGGANVFYMYPERFTKDASTDGGLIFDQMVQTKLLQTGVQPNTNGYQEQYINATAGVYLSRPWAVYRASGI